MNTDREKESGIYKREMAFSFQPRSPREIIARAQERIAIERQNERRGGEPHPYVATWTKHTLAECLLDASAPHIAHQEAQRTAERLQQMILELYPHKPKKVAGIVAEATFLHTAIAKPGEKPRYKVFGADPETEKKFKDDYLLVAYDPNGIPKNFVSVSLYPEIGTHNLRIARQGDRAAKDIRFDLAIPLPQGAKQHLYQFPPTEATRIMVDCGLQKMVDDTFLRSNQQVWETTQMNALKKGIVFSG